jgi:hypothetical protein
MEMTVLEWKFRHSSLPLMIEAELHVRSPAVNEPW